MRRALLSAAILLSFGCNEDVTDGADFGSGGSAAGTSGSAGESGAGAGSAASQGTAADGGSDGAESGSETQSTEAGATSAASSGESVSDTDPSGGETSGGGGTGSSSGEGESGDGTADSDSDSGAPVDDDACGFPLDGPWIQIEYNQAGGTATSPSWSYSETPGWGESQWAASNANWPEVWDIFQNINVSNDPIGVVAVVGGSGRLQLMLGFEELVDYDHATVCVEGRSVSTSASVQFDAYNPLTGIGNSSTMAHDWNMHASGLDLGYAFEPGGGVQAVRIDTTGGSGSLGVKRMRLILHGAVY